MFQRLGRIGYGGLAAAASSCLLYLIFTVFNPTVQAAESSVFAPLDATIFINEFHYDNAGNDENEGVEIAGPAGTDLTGWSLVPYDGFNGLSYSVMTPLSGTIPNLQNGYGTIFFAIADLQNGAPDGIALVDDSSTLIMFLS